MQTGITTWCSLSQVELGCHCALGKIPRNAPSPNNSTHRLLDVIIAHLIITFLLHHIILIILIIPFGVAWKNGFIVDQGGDDVSDN